MEVILGKDGFIQFKKNEDWTDYGCLEAVEIVISSETKQVRTIGDGRWKKPRTKTLSYRITGSGLVRYDDSTIVNGFDLADYQVAGTEIEYRIVFKKWDATDYTMISGFALPTSNTFSAPSDFVSHAFELEGSGAPYIGIPPSCSIEITNVTITRNGLTQTFTVDGVTGGTPIRYDYQLTGIGQGGDTQTSFNASWSRPLPGGFSYHLKVWAMCSNGVLGVLYEDDFNT